MPGILRRKDMPKCRRPYKNIRQIEIGPVQQIESFRAELHVEALGDVRILDERQIPVVEPWAGQAISSGIAQPLTRKGKARDVDVMGRIPRDGIAAVDPIWE